MKTQYICSTCGWTHEDRYTMEFHEKQHKPVTMQFIDKKPQLGIASLLAIVKEDREMIPSMVNVEYNGYAEWYYRK